jgi:hypothetical protein
MLAARIIRSPDTYQCLRRVHHPHPDPLPSREREYVDHPLLEPPSSRARKEVF